MRMDGVVTALRRATGNHKTREQVCNDYELPEAVMECIRNHDSDEPSPHIACMPISNPTNPAYRAEGHVDGRAEMCVARRDLDVGTCVGCHPGSGKQWCSRPAVENAFDAFEDGYCIALRDERGYIVPSQADPNPLSRCNDYRTNIVDPKGPQGREPNLTYVEVWQSGLPYAVFFTLRATKKGEELLWDYGDGYWANADMRNFRNLPLHEQATGWNKFMEDFTTTMIVQEAQSVMCSEAARVIAGGVVWASLMMMTNHEALAAAWISVCAVLYGIVLAHKHTNHAV